MSSQDYLLVYGTLRKDFGLRMMKDVAEQMDFVGTGKVNGLLYDLGDYPGAVKTERGSLVIRGDVFQLKDQQAVLRLLDEYEGEEYKREKTVVELDNGEPKEAWIYWFTGVVEEERKITSEDYLDYLKNKKDRLL